MEGQQQPQPTAQNQSGGEATPAPASPPSEGAAPAAPPTSGTPAPEPQAPAATPSGETGQQPAPQPEPAAPAASEPERQPRPAQRRIQELVSENKTLREQLSPAPIPPVTPQVPKLSDMVRPTVDPVTGQEYLDPSQLDQAGAHLYQQGAQLSSGVSDLKLAQLRNEMVVRDAINDTDKVAAQLPSEYKELSSSDPSYNQALEAKIVNRYQSMAVRPDPLNPGRTIFDPSVKLADVAKEEVGFYREAIESGKAQSSATLATQADNQSVPQSGDAAVEPSFESMTMEQKESYLRAKGHDI